MGNVKLANSRNSALGAPLLGAHEREKNAREIGQKSQNRPRVTTFTRGRLTIREQLNFER
jgi:hypothetical protein